MLFLLRQTVTMLRGRDVIHSFWCMIHVPVSVNTPLLKKGITFWLTLIYIYIYVCVCVFVCACLSVYIYIYMHVCVYIHIHTTKQKYLATLKNFILIKQVRHHSGLIHYTKYMHIIKYKLNKKKNSNILNFWFIKMVLFGRYHCFADSWHSFQPLLWSGDLWLFTLVYPTPVQWDLSPLIEPAKASVYLWLSLLVCFGWLSCVSTNPWATSRIPNGIVWCYSML